MLQAALNSLKVPELRNKLLFTFGILVAFRFVVAVPVPGIDLRALAGFFEGNQLLGILNLFSGNALENFSIGAMTVYPYITASIVMTILTPVIPALSNLSKEGEQGRNQIQRITHYLTVPFAMAQAFSQLVLIQQSGAVTGGLSVDNLLLVVTMISSMTAGTLLLVWLGELITQHGIGNGISVIIFGGIVAALPSLIFGSVITGGNPAGLVVFIVLALFTVVAIVVFQEAQRRIPVQYARTMNRGGRMYRQSGGSHIPLRVNSAGMIPLIFAISIMVFPGIVAEPFLLSDNEVIASVARFIRTVFDPAVPTYWAVYFLLVVAFTFFYTLVIFQQQNLAENLQKNGGFIPGIRPGRPTADYLMRVLVRITWGGAVFLGLVAILPFFAQQITNVQALQLSSTGLLIVVGVVLDTMRQLESQLLMRQYEGFIR